MTAKNSLLRVLDGYDLSNISIGTLGSHSSLNIFKGAKEEGFKTVCVCRKNDAILYQKFPLADEIIMVDSFSELSDPPIQEKLRRQNTVLIPHGSFTAYLSTKQLLELNIPMFGNRQLLPWEADRDKQFNWLSEAGLTLPQTFASPDQIDRTVIAKLPGAKGGCGYFLANSKKTFYDRFSEMVKRGLLRENDIETIHLQEYVIGTNVYPHYFSSIIANDVELLGIDRRYESAVDGISRIPAQEQLEANIHPSYTVVGNLPLAVRESLLPEILRMGDRVHAKAKELAAPGLVGPFCLETVVTQDLKIYTFEISARIVAGTNVGIGTSPYAYLKYGPGMYMGRRIAQEIRQAKDNGQLQSILI